MLTIKTVNRAIEQATGDKVDLVQGEGYLWFAGTDWRHSSVAVCRLNHLSLAEWIEEYKRLKAENQE